MSEENKPDTLMVFSGKSLDTMIKEGGCGYWVVDNDRARRRGYVVAVRNHHSPLSEYDVPHGVAWLVATIRAVVPAPETGRWLIKLGEYATIDKPRAWVGRNPVAYTRLEVLAIDTSSLDWKEFPSPPSEQISSMTAQSNASIRNVEGTVQPLTFDEAKQGLALAMGIRPDQIEITIRA